MQWSLANHILIFNMVIMYSIKYAVENILNAQLVNTTATY